MTAAVVGAAESDLGRTGRSILGLQSQAITRALADAGLSLRDVDGLATAGVSRFSTAQVAEYIGVRPSWTDSTFAGGSGFEMYLARAAQAIEAGQCSTVLITYGSNQASARSRSLSGVANAGMPEEQFETPYAPLHPISYYAMAATRYIADGGATREQLAEVAVAAREWALLNPAAYRYGQGSLTVADVLAAKPVSSPLTVADCCLVTDGGGAVVVTSLERGRDLARPPVVLLGYGERTTNTSMSSVQNILDTGAAESGADAYARAGLRPSDIDVAEIYDSFTITVLLSLEMLGLCPPGEAGAFVEGGRIRPGGDFALNTSGGGLSYCHPGMFGLLLIVEAVRQLRGECGQRQIAGAETALVHGTGGILSTHATLILGQDR